MYSYCKGYDHELGNMSYEVFRDEERMLKAKICIDHKCLNSGSEQFHEQPL
jgi:hypothetical protein